MSYIVERIDHNGRGITYVDNKITFVKDAFIGEEIDLKIINKKSKFNEAVVTKRYKDSDIRVKYECPYYEKCGGCNIALMNYDAQLEFKKNKLIDIMKRFAGIEINPIIIKSNNVNYRNKITLKVKNFKCGYFNSSTHQFVEVNECLLVNKFINEFVSNHKWMSIRSGEIVVRVNNDNKLLISIKSDDRVSFNKVPGNVIGIVANGRTLYGDNNFIYEINDMKYKISYNSFFQTNTEIAVKLFNILNENMSGDSLLDLYCGVGTLGLSVSSNFKKIYGIELIENAIKDAKYNAKINNVENTEFYAGDTGEVLSKLRINVDTVIVDPPRSGLNGDTLELINDLLADNIIYVSCDPMTLARDLKFLSEEYEIEKFYGLDMFPNTYHVECVCVLKLR